MSNTMKRYDQIIGGATDDASHIKYSPSEAGRSDTNVAAELDSLNSDLTAMTDSIISGTKDVAIGGGSVTTVSITVPAGKWLLFAEMTLSPGMSGYASFGFDSSTANPTIGGCVTGVANSLVWMGNNAIGYTNNNTTGSKTVILNVWASASFTGSFKYFGIKLP